MSNQLYLGANKVDNVYVGSTKASAVYLGSTKIWPPSIPYVDGVTAVGDPCLGGYFAGIIDTTVGNIIAADASQTGARYALVVAPKSLEATSLKYKTTDDASPAAASTRWDGLTATTAMNSATYPAAQYCAGLSYDSDGASAWYLPAMDELELIYRNLKPSTDANAVGTRTGSTFPGVDQPYGYNPSSDPAGSAHTASDPTQTTVTAFQSGGPQALDATDSYHQSSTEYSAARNWVEGFQAGNAGLQYDGLKTSSTYPIRPVRRFVLS